MVVVVVGEVFLRTRRFNLAREEGQVLFQRTREGCAGDGEELEEICDL